MRNRNFLLMAGLAVFVLAFAVGCSDDDDPVTPPSSHDAEVTIGTAGGDVEIAGEIELEIQENGVAGDITFTIDDIGSTHDAMVATRVIVSPVYSIGPAGTNFLLPSSLQIVYDESALTGQDEGDLVIYANSGSGWVALATTVIEAFDEAQTDIDHLSYFCVTAPVPVAEPEEITLTATPSIAIPDGPSGGGPGAVAESVINVSQTGTFDDLRVYMNITHGYSSDLIIKLMSPTGTEIRLFFIGEGGEPNTNPAGWYPDDFTPKDPLSSFADESITGNWTLRAYDYSNEQTGTLNEWRLNLSYVPGK